jgi:hypothetical protein
MGGPAYREKDQEALTARARERIEQGQLPSARAARSWGGRGSGLACSLCDTPILETEPEMELEFDGAVSARALRFHLQCQSAWEIARRAPVQAEWTPMGQALPPFDAVVEARLTMSGGRPVILGVVRVRSRGDDAAWMNATTNSPLPDAWTPLEWRYPPGLEPAQSPAESAAPKRA